jgi:hypothetical protein
MKELKDYSGEELAAILGQQFNQLIQAQGNIQAINNELERRKTLVNPEVIDGK